MWGGKALLQIPTLHLFFCHLHRNIVHVFFPSAHEGPLTSFVKRFWCLDAPAWIGQLGGKSNPNLDQICAPFEVMVNCR